MIASSASWKDVAKYYASTFVVIPEVDPHRAFYLVKAGPEGIYLRDNLANEEGFISFDNNFSYELKSPLPVRQQWFSFENRAMFVSRIPARMWRKGICSENTAFMGLTRGGEFSPAAHKESLINALLAFKPPESFPKMTSSMSFAVNEMFAINGKGGEVFLLDKVVGKCAARTKTLFLVRELAKFPLPTLFSTLKVEYV